jgi:hypothetical protein
VSLEVSVFKVKGEAVWHHKALVDDQEIANLVPKRQKETIRVKNPPVLMERDHHFMNFFILIRYICTRVLPLSLHELSDTLSQGPPNYALLFPLEGVLLSFEGQGGGRLVFLPSFIFSSENFFHKFTVLLVFILVSLLPHS